MGERERAYILVMFPPQVRFISIVSLWQFMAIAFGFLLTRASVKLLKEEWTWGLHYYLQRAPFPTRVLAHFTVLVARFGAVLLLVPVAWWILLYFRKKPQEAFAGVQEPRYLVGIVIAIVLTAVFAFTSIYSMYLAYG